MKIILLLPNKETLSKRDKTRAKEAIMGSRTIELYNLFKENKNVIDWDIIDNSNLTIDETLKQIKKIL